VERTPLRRNTRALSSPMLVKFGPFHEIIMDFLKTKYFPFARFLLDFLWEVPRPVFLNLLDIAEPLMLSKKLTEPQLPI
jgi:hypothetical protein